MHLRWAGDDKILRGATALDCLRYHCHGDHSAEARRGDIDGVLRRIAETFKLDPSYAELSTLDERCEAFVKTALVHGLLIDVTTRSAVVVHFSETDSNEWMRNADPLLPTKCGVLGTWTEKQDKVTCAECLRVIEGAAAG